MGSYPDTDIDPIRKSLESREEKLSFMSLMRTEKMCFKLILIVLKEIFLRKEGIFSLSLQLNV